MHEGLGLHLAVELLLGAVKPPLSGGGVHMAVRLVIASQKVNPVGVAGLGAVGLGADGLDIGPNARRDVLHCWH